MQVSKIILHSQVSVVIYSNRYFLSKHRCRRNNRKRRYTSFQVKNIFFFCFKQSLSNFHRYTRIQHINSESLIIIIKHTFIYFNFRLKQVYLWYVCLQTNPHHMLSIMLDQTSCIIMVTYRVCFQSLFFIGVLV